MKILKQILCIVFIIACLVLCISRISFIVRPTDTDWAYYQVETFHSLPDNSLEVIIYGTSHAFRGISPMEMYKEYGIGSYNYAYHGQACNTTNLFLKDSLMTQKPKVVLIDGYNLATVLIDCNINSQIYYSRYIKNKEAHKKYLRQCLGTDIERYLSYYVPVWQFHDNWNTLTQASFTDFEMITSLRETMGFYEAEKVTEVEIPDYTTFPQRQFTDEAIAELDDMMNTCKENGIEVVFFNTPYQGEYYYREALSQYAREHDSAYLDLFELFDDAGLDTTEDFSDAGHLNVFGAKKVADYIGEYLSINYSLTDMRKISGNLWETAPE